MLAEVSPKSREVLALHYLAGYSETELAVAFGVSPATIKSRLHEAREQAKRKLLPIVRAAAGYFTCLRLEIPFEIVPPGFPQPAVPRPSPRETPESPA
jgi:hypothetical protein